jgi:hypothetical protein
MPAAKGVKRAAGAKHQEPKRAKIVDPTEEKCDVVAAVLSEASDLPEACRNMLRAAVPSALSVVASARHECQANVVAMIGDVFASMEAGLEARSVDAASKVDSAVANTARLEALQGDAENALTRKLEAVEAARAKLQENEVCRARAQAALQEATAAQKQGSESMSLISDEKAAYEAAMKDSFTPLKDGAPEVASNSKQHVEVILPLCKPIGLDQSLLNAFPSAAAKKLDDRGTFDSMVFQQLEEDISKHIASLAEKLSSGAPAAAEHMVAVQTAQAVVDAAMEEQSERNNALQAAKEEQREAEGTLKAAKQAVRDSMPQQRTAETERDAAQTRLADFRQGPLATLRDLSGREEDSEQHAVEEIGAVPGSSTLK